ncbi:MAG: glycosyltransferase family 39 protein [Candidatus Aenigmatarchaeota archaeon]
MNNRTIAILVAVIILGASLRIFYFSKQSSVWWDETVYMAMADAYAGNNYFFEAFRPPLLPFSLFLWESLFGFSFLSSRIFVLLVSISVIPVVYALTKKATDNKVAFATSALIATDIFSILYSSRVLTEDLAILFGAISVASFYIGYKNDSTRWLALSGVSIALAMMSKHFMAYLGIVVLAFLAIKRGTKVLYDRKLYIVALAGLTVMSPWLAVNYIQFGNPLWPQFSNIGLSPPTSLLFYASVLPLFLGVQGLLIPFAFIGIRKSKHYEFLKFNFVAIIIALTVLHIVAHKEDRFLGILSYSAIILEAVGLLKLSEIFGKIFAGKRLWKNDYPGKAAAVIIAVLFVISFVVVAAIPRQYEDMMYKCADEIKKLPNQTMSTTMSPYFSYFLKRNFIQLPWNSEDFSCKNMIDSGANYTIYYSSGWYQPLESAFLNQTKDCTTLLVNITQNQKCLIFRVEKQHE